MQRCVGANPASHVDFAVQHGKAPFLSAPLFSHLQSGAVAVDGEKHVVTVALGRAPGMVCSWQMASSSSGLWLGSS